MKFLSFAVSFPRHHAKIKDQGYISLKLHVVVLNDLNVKCFSSLRGGPALGNDLWRFSDKCMENQSRISRISIAECNFTSLLKNF